MAAPPPPLLRVAARVLQMVETIESKVDEARAALHSTASHHASTAQLNAVSDEAERRMAEVRRPNSPWHAPRPQCDAMCMLAMKGLCDRMRLLCRVISRSYAASRHVALNHAPPHPASAHPTSLGSVRPRAYGRVDLCVSSAHRA